MTFSSESGNSRLEKIILCTIEAQEKAKIFDLYSSSTYYRSTDKFISAVYDGTTALVAGSLPLSAGQFFYDKEAGLLYLRTSDSVDPKTKNISLRYKLFYSTAGSNLPHGLSTGDEVHWEGRLRATGSIKQQLDDENTGVVVESSSSIQLINSDGYFDEIFDTLVWENKTCEFWTWLPNTPIASAKKLFSGVVEEKTYSPEQVTFKLKDFTFRLRDKVNLSLFSTSDGNLSDSDLNTPKRRIFGRVDKAQCVGVDKELSGEEISITLYGTMDEEFITFSSSIYGIVFPGDQIEVDLPDGSIESIGIDSITSSTVCATNALDFSFSATSFRLKSERGSRRVNRDWYVSGHKLYEPTATITQVISSNRYIVDSVDGFFPDDPFEINGETGTIRRISGLQLVTDQVISPDPVVTDVFTRPAITQVFWKDKLLSPSRDYTYTNTTECVLSIDALAEFYNAKQRTLTGTTITFTTSSQAVASSSTSLDLRTILRPRDWIRSPALTHTTWYEISEVEENSLTLVTTFGGTTGGVTAQYKNVEYINDDDLITVSCYGMDNAGEWVKTPSDAVKYLLENDAQLTAIDTDSFSEADQMCDYIVSMILPARTGEGLPSIRDTISQINSSVFGALYTSADFLLSYSILNSSKPESLEILKDDDIYSFNVESKNQIVSDVIVKYRPFVDTGTGEDTFLTYEFASDFVDEMVGIDKKEEITLYLYETDKAQIIGQRHTFFKSLSNSRLTLNGPIDLSNYSLGDKLYVELDRLYKRYGGRDKRKIVVISGITQDGYGATIEGVDMGNIFNRVPAICPNTQGDYADSDGEEIAKYGFILDNNTETPDSMSESELGNNLIG